MTESLSSRLSRRSALKWAGKLGLLSLLPKTAHGSEPFRPPTPETEADFMESVFPTLSLAEGRKALRWFAATKPYEVLTAYVNAASKDGKWSPLRRGDSMNTSALHSFTNRRAWAHFYELARQGQQIEIRVTHTHLKNYARRFKNNELSERERAVIAQLQQRRRERGLDPIVFDPTKPFGTPPSAQDLQALSGLETEAQQMRANLGLAIKVSESVVNENEEWIYELCESGICRDKDGHPLQSTGDSPTTEELQVRWALFVNGDGLTRRPEEIARVEAEIIEGYARYGVSVKREPFRE